MAELNKIAVDVENGVHYQIVKLAHGGSGVFNDIEPENPLTNIDFLTNVKLGNVPGNRIRQVVGVNPVLTGVNVFQDVRSGGPYVESTGAESWEIVSTDVNDTLSGSGCGQVFVDSLDAAGLEQTKQVDMNGTTPVAISGTHLKPDIIRAFHGINIGTIIVKQVSTGNIRNTMRPGDCTSFDGRYTVPSNKKASLLTAFASIGKNDDATVRTIIRENISDAPEIVSPPIDIYQIAIMASLVDTQILQPLTDFIMESISKAGNAHLTLIFAVLEIEL